MSKQCSSCGGDCGRTKKTGCRYADIKINTGHKGIQMNVIEGTFDKKLETLAHFQKTVEELIETLDGNLTVAELVGTLEFIKHNLINR